jgi:pyridoxal phosphate enzyme (YggS family)
MECAVGIDERLARVRERIGDACTRAGRDPAGVSLIAVSKTFPAEAVSKAYAAGLRDFGENRVQEGSAKIAALAREVSDARWHLIGHLQTNKVPAALEHFDVIHSVDSVRLLDAIAARMPGNGEVHIFIQVNVSGEASKSGVSTSSATDLIARARDTRGVILDGLMTIAPIEGGQTAAHRAFGQLRRLAEHHGLEQLSMGMSGDFEAAIEEGATHVRIGQAIFGGRA